MLTPEAKSTVRTCQGSEHCHGSQQLPGAPWAGLDAGSAQALSCQPGISHSLQHLTLGLLWRKGQPPNPPGTGTALLWGAHTHLDWESSMTTPCKETMSLSAALPATSPHPAPHDEPRAARAPMGHPPPMAAVPTESTAHSLPTRMGGVTASGSTVPKGTPHPPFTARTCSAFPGKY